MVYYILLFFIICFIYLYVSLKEKTIYNLLFYDMYSIAGLMVFFNIVRLFLKERYYDVNIGDIILIIFFLALFLNNALLLLNVKPIKFISFSKREISKLFLFCMAGVVLTYFLLQPELLKLMITNPRMFYASTRIGGGVIYYIILPIILFLFFYLLSHAKKFKIILLIFIFFIPIIYLFGQKTLFLKIAIFIVTLYYYKNCNKKNIDKNILFLFLIASVGLVGAFYFYSLQQNIDIASSGLVNSMANYADYLDNFNKLIENLKEHTYGGLTIEKEFYSRIPRFIFPNKPKIFGDVKLASFIPEYKRWVEAFTGAPSCGPLGLFYADFGPILAIIFKVIISGVLILIAKGYHNDMKKNGYNFFSHITMFTLLGGGIFYSPSEIFPIEGILCIWGIYTFLTVKGEKLR